MSRIEDEAKEFKRQRDAERQRRHRAGTKTYQVQLDRITVNKLIRARQIPAGARDAVIAAEIANVVAWALDGRLRVTPALPPETRVDLSPADASQPKAKGKHRRKKDPGRILVGAEKARIAAQTMAEEERRRVAEEDRIRLEAKWANFVELDPVKMRQLKKERLAREKEEKAAAIRAKLDALPPQAPKARVFQSLGKSGISKKGGKPVPNGFASHQFPKSQADTVAPIKMKLKAADVKRFEQITPVDDSVHTLPATEAEHHEMYSGTGPE